MGADFIFRNRLKVQPPPCASLFFIWILLRVPELVIGARETENAIGCGFRPGDLCINMATKFYPGVSLQQNRFILHIHL